MDDVLGEHREELEDDENDDEDHDLAPVGTPSTIGVPSLGPDVMRGTGLVYPSKFGLCVSPLQPMELFSGRARFMNIVR
jgi:ribonuclease HI